MSKMHADEAEQAVLGAILQGWTDVDDLRLTEAEFRNPVLGQVWDVLARMRRDRLPVDPITVRPELGHIRLNADPGLVLMELMGACPVNANAPTYADQVREAAQWRRLDNAVIAVQQRVNGGEGTAAEVAEEARTWFADAPYRDHGRAETLTEFMPELFKAIETGTMQGVRTGWPDLDRLISGLVPGRLYVVGARPGVGKSLMGAGMAKHFAVAHELPAHVVSLEMGRVELAMRIMADVASVDHRRMANNQLDAREWDRMATAVDKVRDAPLVIDDTPSQTMTDIRRSARDTAARFGPLGVVVVDYLQLIGSRDRKLPRQEQVSEISRELKLLARDLHCPVLALAQLNRQAGDRPPVLTDLRESGAIEQDADVVLLLHDEDDDTAMVSGHVVKQRGGPQGQFDLLRQGQYGRLVSVS